LEGAVAPLGASAGLGRRLPNPAVVNSVRTLIVDIQAARNAVIEPWSNGQAEGQINRLKAKIAQARKTPRSTSSRPRGQAVTTGANFAHREMSC